MSLEREEKWGGRRVRHLAIILDGNRRWAVEHGLPRFLGHTEGAKNLKPIVEAVLQEGIPYLTFYCLSSENLRRRSREELNHLFNLFTKLIEHAKLFHQEEVRLLTIGDTRGLPVTVQEAVARLARETSGYRRLTLALALNYGGRDEIVRAAKKSRELPPDFLEEEFAALLDTNGLPDVDLVIRTGGCQRLSNFLPWQTVYAELYFTETKWPAFTPAELRRALDWFSRQQRNYGK